MSFIRNLFGKNDNETSDLPLTPEEDDFDSDQDQNTEEFVPPTEAKTTRFDSVTRNLTAESMVLISSGQPQFAYVSDKGIVRDNNEDAAYVMYTTNGMVDGGPNFGLFIIADGMGGHQLGERASALAVRSAASYVIDRLYLPMLRSEDNDRPPVAEVLIAAVKAANEAVMNTITDGGTTLSVMVLLGDWGHFAHVGDSRAYLVTKDSAELITRDHSYVQRLIELNQITVEESKNHPQRSVLYRAIGQSDNIEVDTLSRRLMAGASILLCSDGLWDVVTNHQIREIVNNLNLTPYQACEKLCALAIAQGSTDNISAVLLRMPG